MIPGRKNSTTHTWRQKATKDVTGLNGLGMLMARERQGTRMQRESHFCSLGAPLCGLSLCSLAGEMWLCEPLAPVHVAPSFQTEFL